MGPSSGRAHVVCAVLRANASYAERETIRVFGVGSFASLKACARSSSVARVIQRLAMSSSTSFRRESVALSANSLHLKLFWRHSCGSMGITRLFLRQSLPLNDHRTGINFRHLGRYVISTFNNEHACGTVSATKARFGTLAASQN